MTPEEATELKTALDKAVEEYGKSEIGTYWVIPANVARRRLDFLMWAVSTGHCSDFGDKPQWASAKQVTDEQGNTFTYVHCRLKGA